MHQNLKENIDFKTFKFIASELELWVSLTLKSFHLAFGKLSLSWIIVTLFAALIWFAIIANLGQLIEDFNLVPIINFCKETATFPSTAFLTQNPQTINTYFSYAGESNK